MLSNIFSFTCCLANCPQRRIFFWLRTKDFVFFLFKKSTCCYFKAMMMNASAGNMFCYFVCCYNFPFDTSVSRKKNIGERKIVHWYWVLAHQISWKLRKKQRQFIFLFLKWFRPEWIRSCSYSPHNRRLLLTFIRNSKF